MPNEAVFSARSRPFIAVVVAFTDWNAWKNASDIPPVRSLMSPLIGDKAFFRVSTSAVPFLILLSPLPVSSKAASKSSLTSLAFFFTPSSSLLILAAAGAALVTMLMSIVIS